MTTTAAATNDTAARSDELRRLVGVPDDAGPVRFVEEVPRLLKRAGLSLTDVTRRTAALDGDGISTALLSLVLTGKTPPTARTVGLVSRALDLPPERFLEYRLARTRELLDPKIVGFETAAANLRAMQPPAA